VEHQVSGKLWTGPVTVDIGLRSIGVLFMAVQKVSTRVVAEAGGRGGISTIGELRSLGLDHVVEMTLRGFRGGQPVIEVLVGPRAAAVWIFGNTPDLHDAFDWAVAVVTGIPGSLATYVEWILIRLCLGGVIVIGLGLPTVWLTHASLGPAVLLAGAAAWAPFVIYQVATRVFRLYQWFRGTRIYLVDRLVDREVDYALLGRPTAFLERHLPRRSRMLGWAISFAIAVAAGLLVLLFDRLTR
jgi:hypothetical protein